MPNLREIAEHTLAIASTTIGELSHDRIHRAIEILARDTCYTVEEIEAEVDALCV